MAIKSIHIILALVGVVAVVIFMQSGTSDGDDFISWECFDPDQQPMDCETGAPLSTVGTPGSPGTPGIGWLRFTVKALNTGDIPLTCSIVSASPSIFATELGSSLKIAPILDSATWTTGLIEMEPLEALSQPVSFSATMRCSFRSGVDTITLADKTGVVQLTIFTDDINAGFIIDFDPPDTGTVVCGDLVCHTPVEDAVNCPVDCTVGGHSP